MGCATAWRNQLVIPGVDERDILLDNCTPTLLDHWQGHRRLTRRVIEAFQTTSCSPVKLKVIFCVQGVISPLLANLFLHWFDALFQGAQGPARWADAKLVRYADDLVMLAREWTAELTAWVESKLEGKFGREINREKTRVVEVKAEGEVWTFWATRFGMTGT